jgi:hypothetical protein
MREKDTEDPTRLRLVSQRSEAKIAAERRRHDAQRAAEVLSYAACPRREDRIRRRLDLLDRFV